MTLDNLFRHFLACLYDEFFYVYSLDHHYTACSTGTISRYNHLLLVLTIPNLTNKRLDHTGKTCRCRALQHYLPLRRILESYKTLLLQRALQTCQLYNIHSGIDPQSTKRL